MLGKVIKSKDRWAVAAGDGWSQGNGVTQETTTVYDGEALSAVPEI